MPRNIVSTDLIYLILSRDLRCRHYYCSHFINEETETHRKVPKLICGWIPTQVVSHQRPRCEKFTLETHTRNLDTNVSCTIAYLECICSTKRNSNVATWKWQVMIQYDTAFQLFINWNITWNVWLLTS